MGVCMLSASFYAGTKFPAKAIYHTFERDHQWFLQTPVGEKPIYESHEVGTVESRLLGLLKEDVSVLYTTLDCIRQESKTISDID
jgi:hypothetical protein